MMQSAPVIMITCVMYAMLANICNMALVGIMNTFVNREEITKAGFGVEGPNVL